MSRYLIGIDLGTTNTALAYVEQGKGGIHQFCITQETANGVFEEKTLLPSFCYLGEYDNAVGVYAKELGSKTPTRLISSAKSWLCNNAARRREKILPLDVFDESRRLSPVESTSLYLRHLVECWNKHIAKNDPSKLFENQEVVITVPASFDQVARLLTLESARDAGIKNPLFLEEPQAAFYSWIYSNQNKLAQYFKGGQTILVVDVGGGTLDFSLIEVSNELTFEREKVGRHLLLGGDNMDEALAHLIADKMGGIHERDWQRLVFLAKNAKEDLLSTKDKVSIVLSQSGTGVIRGAKTVELHKEEVEDLLLQGFFKVEDFEQALKHEETSALMSMGLPYEKESSILKHLAKFLGRNSKIPDFVLFNGGALKPFIFRDKVLQALERWYNAKRPQELVSACFDLAVSKGAAYFLMVQKGLGVKIESRVPCSYFITVNDVNEKKALALIPKGADYGYEYVSDKEFFSSTNTPLQFTVLYSNTLLGIEPGRLYPINEDEQARLPPLLTVLKMGQKSDKVKLHLSCNITHMGSLELHLKAQNTPHKFSLEFDLQDENGKKKHEVGLTLSEDEVHHIKALFSQTLAIEPKNYVKIIQDKLKLEKNQWPASILRALYDEMFLQKSFIKKDPLRFWNLAGFLLRPGSGYALDDFRIKELWKLILEEFNQVSCQDVMTQKWICFRRIALGLNKGSQIQIASLVQPFVIKVLEGKQMLKNRNDEYLFSEKLRLIASLELIDLQTKIKIGNLLVKKIKKGPIKEVEVFALSRLGARYLLTRSITHIIPPCIIEGWIDELKEFLKIIKN